MAGIHRRASRKTLRRLFAADVRPVAAQALDLHDGMVLCLARLLRYAPLRRGPQAGHAHLLLQHQSRLAGRLGRRHSDPRRRRPLQDAFRTGLQGPSHSRRAGSARKRQPAFQRTAHSWHGVLPLTAPPGQLRKLFIITVNVPTWQVIFRRLRGKDPDGYSLKAKAA